MTNNVSIELANPFAEGEKVFNSISDIKKTSSKVVHKSDKGLIVSMPNNESALLEKFDDEDFSVYELGQNIDIYIEPGGNIYRDNNYLDLYEKMLAKAEDGQTFIGEIICATKADALKRGLIVNIDGLQSFMPEGQIGYDHSDLQSLVGTKIDVKLISIKLKEKEENRFLPIVSHKAIVEEKYHDKIKDVKIGDILTGTVKSIAKYGVFVTLFPAIDGLVALSELSWNKITDPNDVVKIGQKQDVIILDIKEIKNGKPKISLGVKQLCQKPWDAFAKSQKVGDIVSGTVCNIEDYGIFVMLPCGLQCLVHRTELSWKNNVNTKDYSIGETITAKIINIDFERQKVALSIRQMQPDPWDTIEEKYSVGDKVDVIINQIVKFAIFVKIDDMFDGYIHVSDLSWTEIIKNPDESFFIGDHLDAVIIKINKEKRRIDLSHKRVLPNPWNNYWAGQLVDAVVVGVNNNGVIAKLQGSNLPAYIPFGNAPKDISFEENDTLCCVVKEIDEHKYRIILSIN